VGHTIATVITPIQDHNAASITVGDKQTQVQVSINNTIPNAMIWVQVTVSDFELPEEQPVVGSVYLSYYGTPNVLGLFSAVFPVYGNQSGSLYFGLSTCSTQFSIASGEFVDLGDKQGNWTFFYYNIDTAYNFSVDVTIGAQPGGLSANQNYTLDSVPTPVVYFDLDLSSPSIGNASMYDVTLTLYTNSASGLSWLTGAVIRSNNCPQFSYSFDLLANSNQYYLQSSSTGQQLSMVFQSLPALPSHLAIQMSRDAIGAGLTINWSAKAIAVSSDVSPSSSSGDDNEGGWTLATIVLGSTTLALIVMCLFLVVVIGLMLYKLLSARKQYTAI